MNAQVEEIISELNYALALPFVTIEQKSKVRDEINRIHKKAFASLKQPAQEPDGTTLYEMNVYGDGNVYRGLRSEESTVKTYHVNTHPAPSWQGNKEFVGLSDAEIFNLSQQCDLNHILGLIDYGRAIEQELKTKNGFSGLKEKNT